MPTPHLIGHEALESACLGTSLCRVLRLALGVRQENRQMRIGFMVNDVKTEEALTAPLYEEIGRLKMDVKWLEKKL